MDSFIFLIRWFLYVVASFMIILALVSVITALRMSPRTLSLRDSSDLKETLLKARQETIERSSHLEKMLATLGLMELAIAAYVGGMVIDKTSEVISEPLFFWLTIIVFFAITVAYLHVGKLLMSYGIYCVQLEIAGLEKGLRPTSEVFYISQNTLTPKWLKPLIATASSLQIVSLFPIFILVTAVIGFGYRFHIPTDIVLALTLLFLGWSVMYIIPATIEFLKLVNQACAGK